MFYLLYLLFTRDVCKPIAIIKY